MRLMTHTLQTGLLAYDSLCCELFSRQFHELRMGSHRVVSPLNLLMLTSSTMRVACVTESIPSLVYPERLIGYIW